jgi:hypothetical protein
MHTAECMVELKEGADDLDLWEWIQKVLEYLGPDGMSSEESAIEGIEKVYRVKIVEWRRNLDKEMDIIDRQRLLDSDIFSPRGSLPVARIRTGERPHSSRTPVSGLPRTFYDKKWLEEQSERYRRLTLCVSREQFQWFKIAVDRRMKN